MPRYTFNTDLVRSHTMSRIKNKNTSIEVALRKALWRSGIRYRVNYAKLPGKPDIAVTKHKIAIFCDGEFWHGKDWEKNNERLKSNRDYWIPKIERNITRDNEINQTLSYLGWTVVRFWGVDIQRNLEKCVEDVKIEIFQNQLDTILYNELLLVENELGLDEMSV